MAIDLLFVVAGIALLVVGGDLLVAGATTLSKRLGLSPAVIGIVVLGFGTSTPELVTSVTAAVGGQSGVALGNVVGSNIANILLVLGLTALVYPIACDPHVIQRDGTMMVVVTTLTVVALVADVLSRPLGLFLLAMLSFYLWAVVRQERGGGELDEESLGIPIGPAESLAGGIVRAVIGLAILLVGARLLVVGASSLAADLGASEALIGLTVVAVGTSLPELSASITAALKKQSAMAFGNVVGSNVFNLAAVLGGTLVIRPFAVPAGVGLIDAVALVIATGLCLFVGRTGLSVVRWEGGVLVLGYAAYIALTSVY